MRTFSLFLLATTSLAGCTTLPRPIATMSVSAPEIVRAVECDLASVFRNPAIEGRLLIASLAKVELDLVRTDDNNLKPGATFKATVAQGTTVETKPKGELSDKGVRTSEVDFGVKFADIDPRTRLGKSIASRCPTPDSQLAADGLGLAEWLHDALVGASGEDTAVQLGLITFKQDFTVTRTLKGGLVFTTNIASFGLDESQLSRKQQNTIFVKIEVKEPPVVANSGITPLSADERLMIQTRPERGTTILVDPDQKVIIEAE